MPVYADPDLAQGVQAYQHYAKRINRRQDQIANARADVLSGLTVGPRSIGYVEFLAGRPADTEDMEINGTRIYWDGGTPDPTADVSVGITATINLGEDLDALAAAVAAYGLRDFDVFVLPNDLGFGIWWVETPDNTKVIDVTGTANAVASAGTLLQGKERKGLAWEDQYVISAEDVLALAGGEDIPIAVLPYQGADLKVCSVVALTTAGAIIPLVATMSFVAVQVTIDTTVRYWVLYLTDSAATLAATDVVGFVVSGE